MYFKKEKKKIVLAFSRIIKLSYMVHWSIQPKETKDIVTKKLYPNFIQKQITSQITLNKTMLVVNNKY